MKIIGVGNLKSPSTPTKIGILVEATREEAREAARLLYEEVDIVDCRDVAYPGKRPAKEGAPFSPVQLAIDLYNELERIFGSKKFTIRDVDRVFTDVMQDWKPHDPKLIVGS